MAEQVKWLVRPVEIKWPEDIETTRRWIRECGFDASDADIQWALRKVAAKYNMQWIDLECFARPPSPTDVWYPGLEAAGIAKDDVIAGVLECLDAEGKHSGNEFSGNFQERVTRR